MDQNYFVPNVAGSNTAGYRADLGIVNVRDYGAAGNGVRDDTSAIQTALNTGKPVYIPDGSYRVTATLIMPAGSQLTLANKARLVPYANNTVLRMKKNCRLSGGTIDLTAFPSFSMAAIYIDGADRLYLDQLCVDDLHIRGGTNRLAKGLFIECNQENEYVCYCFFSRIVINNCDIGVYLKCSGNGAFINGNSFDMLAFDRCTYGIRLEHDTTKNCEVSGNHFMKVQFDKGPNTKNYIYCTGYHNNFQFMPWDLGQDGSTATCIELTASSEYNAVFLNYDAFSKFIVNRGKNNWFIYK